MSFDEMRGLTKARRVREPYRDVGAWLEAQDEGDLRRKGAEAEAM